VRGQRLERELPSLPTVRDLMTAPAITIGPAAPLRAAHELMDARGVHHLPVVDKEGRIVGAIADRDLDLGLELERTVEGLRQHLRVVDVMHSSPPTIDADAAAHEAAALLLAKRVGALAVLDGDRLVGMITATDFIEVARRTLAARTAAPPPLEPGELRE
jgi:acetoin utilization protein AcuB